MRVDSQKATQSVRLAYHTYRQQLRNLAHWLHKLLHERLDEEQRANDLEMIGFHCLDRWEGIEQATTYLVQHYATFSGRLR